MVHSFFFFISWRLITLQYCSGFCHTLTRISHGFTCIPHPDPPPTSLSARSLWVFPVHQVRALVSWIQPGLVICLYMQCPREAGTLLVPPPKHTKYYFSFEKNVKRNIFYSKSSFPKLYPWPQCKLGWEFSHQYLRSTILRLKLNSWPKHLRLSPFKLTWNQVKSSGASLVAQW